MEYQFQYAQSRIPIDENDDEFTNLRSRLLQEGNYELGLCDIHRTKIIRCANRNPLNDNTTITSLNKLSWKVTTTPTISRSVMTRSDLLTRICRVDHAAKIIAYKLNESF